MKLTASEEREREILLAYRKLKTRWMTQDEHDRLSQLQDKFWEGAGKPNEPDGGYSNKAAK